MSRFGTLLSLPRVAGRAALVAGPLLLAGGPSAASAQDLTLPLCPVGEAGIATTAPAYVRRGDSYSVTLTRAGANVASVVVEFVPTVPGGAASASTTETFSFDNGDRLKFVRIAPATGDALDLNVSWVQDSGTPAACRGYDRHPAIPIVAAEARAGTPGFGRFEGKYRISRRNADHPTWTLTPTCDVFACATTFRSSLGLKGTLKFDATARKSGQYTFRGRELTGWCEITDEDGGPTITRREFGTRTIKLRPVKVIDGIATELRGFERWDYEIPSDRYGDCETEPSSVTRIVAKLR